MARASHVPAVGARTTGFPLPEPFTRRNAGLENRWVSDERGSSPARGGTFMQKGVGFRWIVGTVGIFGSIAPAEAQTPNANTKFDGTYAFVSGTKVNETFHHGAGQCPNIETMGIGPLIIVKGQVKYVVGAAGPNEGTIDAQGQITTEGMNPRSLTKIDGTGKINGDGTINLRSVGWFCDQDLVWRRANK